MDDGINIAQVREWMKRGTGAVGEYSLQLSRALQEIQFLRGQIATYERCLPVPEEHRVKGSHIGSVQNYIVRLERENIRLSEPAG